MELNKYPLAAMDSEQDRYRMISMSQVNLNRLEILLHHRRHTVIQLLNCKDDDMRKLLVKYVEMAENEIKKELMLMLWD